MYFLQVIKDIAFLFAILLAGVGICGIILWMSTRKTMWREARVEVTTSILDDLDYAAWRIGLFFSTMDKNALVRKSTYLLVVTACLAVVTDGLNRGTITWWGIAWTIGVIITVMLALLFFCIFKENSEQSWRKC